MSRTKFITQLFIRTFTSQETMNKYFSYGLMSILLILSACCTKDFNSNHGFIMRFDDSLMIDKIDFVEASRSRAINNSVAQLTLNPNDTMCTFNVYYKNTLGVIENGWIKFSYTKQLIDEKDGCNDNNGLKIKYNVSVSAHSFSNVVIDSIYGYEKDDRATVIISR